MAADDAAGVPRAHAQRDGATRRFGPFVIALVAFVVGLAVGVGLPGSKGDRERVRAAHQWFHEYAHAPAHFSLSSPLAGVGDWKQWRELLDQDGFLSRILARQWTGAAQPELEWGCAYVISQWGVGDEAFTAPWDTGAYKDGMDAETQQEKIRFICFQVLAYAHHVEYGPIGRAFKDLATYADEALTRHRGRITPIAKRALTSPVISVRSAPHAFLAAKLSIDWVQELAWYSLRLRDHHRRAQPLSRLFLEVIKSARGGDSHAKQFLGRFVADSKEMNDVLRTMDLGTKTYLNGLRESLRREPELLPEDGQTPSPS